MTLIPLWLCVRFNLFFFIIINCVFHMFLFLTLNGGLLVGSGSQHCLMKLDNWSGQDSGISGRLLVRIFSSTYIIHQSKHALVSLYYTVHKGSILKIVIFIFQMSLFYKLHGKFVLFWGLQCIYKLYFLIANHLQVKEVKLTIIHNFRLVHLILLMKILFCPPDTRSSPQRAASWSTFPTGQSQSCIHQLSWLCPLFPVVLEPSSRGSPVLVYIWKPC